MKVIKVISYTVCILFLVWFFVSYLDIVAHNLSGGQDHVWNFFNLWIK